MDFITLDVETANPNLESICQIGLVAFQDGVVSGSWQRLVNPEDYFDDVIVSIHGIDEKSVEGGPTFPQIRDFIIEYLSGKIVVSHTSFDRVALARTLEKYGLAQIECTWLDTAKVVRRAWPEFSQKGYGLGNIAGKLGIKFVHHNAQEDARAAGEILLHAINVTGLTIQDWLDRVKRPINLSHSSSSRIAIEGNQDGPLFGEVVVFTGALSIHRNQAAELAAVAGCQVAASVKKTTTLLIVGDQDIRRLAGHEKSSKHRKAEEMIAAGQYIRILGESDFRWLIGLTA